MSGRFGGTAIHSSGSGGGERSDRVIALIDMDCFYAQVEQRLRPELWGKPVAVVQYNQSKRGGIIAVSYEARAFGLKRKGMRGDEAKKLCPELTLCEVPLAEHADKPDLTRYREASTEVFKVLNDYDAKIVVERASVDEAFLDLTTLVDSLMSDPETVEKIVGTTENFPTTHVATGEDVEKPVESMVERESSPEHDPEASLFQSDDDEPPGPSGSRYDREMELKKWLEDEASKDNLQMRLAVGAEIVEKIRRKISEVTQFHCSAGIGTNKIIAKLVCARHKPRQQTIIPSQYISEIFRTTPIGKVWNLGGKLGHELKIAFGVKTMADLGRIPRSELRAQFPQEADWVEQICAGMDKNRVKARDKQQSLAVCRMFSGKSALGTIETVSEWLRGLTKELQKRLIEDQLQHQRTAQTITVGCSQEGEHHSRQSKLVSYDLEVMLSATMAALKPFNTAKDGTSWLPPIENLSLSCSRFRPGVSAVTQTISKWITERMQELEERKVQDDTDVIPVYKTKEEFEEFEKKRDIRWANYERVQALPGNALPAKRDEIPGEILDNLPDEIRHELNHFYHLKEARESAAAGTSGTNKKTTKPAGRPAKRNLADKKKEAKKKEAKTMKISDFFGDGQL